MAGREVRIVPSYDAETVRAGGDVDDASPVGGLQRGQQVPGELEVAEVIGRELDVVAARVMGRAAGSAGAIDEDVKRTARHEPAGRESPDRVRIDEVELADLDAIEPGQGVPGALRVAGRHRDGRAGPAQRSGRLEAQAGVASRHDDGLAAHVDAGDDVGGGGSGLKAGSDRVLLVGHERCP